MSQQGIFSIAPDSQNGSTNGANGEHKEPNGSPFSSVTTPADSSSPFAAVGTDSPFHQVAQPTQDQNSAIPQPRVEGEPPVIGASAENNVTARAESPEPTQAFETVNDPTGGPFQMNGFPEQQASQFMEAAPVAPAKEQSPFSSVAQPEAHDYEAAKAGLEPQQDFAAVQPRYQMSEPATEPARATQALYQEQAPSQPTPTQAIRAAAMEDEVEPPFQQVAPEPAPAPAQVATPVTTVPAPTPEPVPEPVRQEQPKPEPQQQAKSQPQPFAPMSSKNTSAGIQQLELRAIFGVNHVLSQDEILQRARTLPGIRNVAVIGGEEANALSNFRQALQGMGFGNSDEMKLSSGGGTVDFLSEGDATLAVLREESYAPGVQETLIFVAREIGKLA